MYKVENKSIEISNIKTKNRLLNNYLDWIIYCMLPSSIGDVLFPKFMTFGIQFYAMETAYIKKNATQVIADSATTMSYTTDEFSNELTTDEVLTTNGKIVTALFPNVATAFSNGDTFEGIGFGRANFDPGGVPIMTDYLLSFIDVSASQIVYNDTQEYGITRVDEITTDEKIISGDYKYLPGKLLGTLQSISMCYGVEGRDIVKEYLLSDLTFTVVGVGNVSVTGFDDFYYEDNILYPKTTLYPSTILYPTQPYTQIKSVRFKYQVWDYGGANYGICETYINIKDLNISYNNTDMSINLICERG